MWFLVIALTAASSPVAEDPSPCFAKGQTYEIATCLGEARARADAELNQLYGKVMSVLEGADKARLQKAERAWLRYRDAMCDAEYGLWGGGTGGPPAHLACLDRETRRRTAELRQLYRLRLQRSER